MITCRDVAADSGRSLDRISRFSGKHKTFRGIYPVISKETALNSKKKEREIFTIARSCQTLVPVYNLMLSPSLFDTDSVLVNRLQVHIGNRLAVFAKQCR